MFWLSYLLVYFSHYKAIFVSFFSIFFTTFLVYIAQVYSKAFDFTFKKISPSPLSIFSWLCHLMKTLLL